MPGKIDNEPIPSPVRDLVAVFAQQLADVQFPGVGHDELTALTARVEEHSNALEQAKTQALAAENGLNESRRELLAKAEQALAYAKIYAASDPTLLNRLSSIKLGKAPKKAVKTRAKAGTDNQDAPRKKVKKVGEQSVQSEAPVTLTV